MRKFIPILLCAILFSGFKTHAQFNVLGADAYGRANSIVAVHSISSFYHNPGGLAGIHESFVSAGFLKTLPVDGFMTLGAQGFWSNPLIKIGFSADSFGDRYYRETQLGFVAAKKLDKVSIGAKISYLGIGVEDMAQKNSILGELGMIVQPSSFFSLGLHLRNFTRARFYDGSTMPSILAFGGAFYPNKKLTLSVQSDYILNESIEFRYGLRYSVTNELAFSCGVDPALKSIHFGTDFNIRKYGFAYAVATHPNVGLASNLTLVFRFNE